jgi:hypothetical protein
LGTTLTTGLGTTGASDDEVLVLFKGRVGRGLTLAVRRSQLRRGCSGFSSVLVLLARSATWSNILASVGGYTEHCMTGEQMSTLQMRRGVFRCTVATGGCQGAWAECLACNHSRRLL